MEPGSGAMANSGANVEVNAGGNAYAEGDFNVNVEVNAAAPVEGMLMGAAAAGAAAAAEPRPIPAPPAAFEQPFNARESAALSASLVHTYFTTQFNPLTRHHIDSYDQFLQRDLKSIITSHNPLIVLKNPKARKDADDFKYKAEIYIGGETGTEITISTPTIVLDQGRDVRLLFPNEARLRALTYSTQISANVLVRVTILQDPTKEEPNPPDYIENITIENMPLFNLPLMLHSSSCLLHGKPASMLTQMGECPQDQGGYFIVDGSEKVLVTRQEGAFNTLWITRQNDPLIEMYSSISSLNPKTREVKRVSFYWTREISRQSKRKKGGVVLKESILEVSIPFVLKPVPIFVLFRALGIQTDKDILQMIFPDMSSPETKYLADLLIPSINAAAPFLDTYSAVQYIKTLTKNFSVEHVLDIIHNQLFPHVEDLPNARAVFLADCVHKILRVAKNLDAPASRDDTRNQRLLTAGFLIQMMFGYNYRDYTKAVVRRADETFAYNESIYSGTDFSKIFKDANQRNTFHYGFLSERIQRAFKGKWSIGSGKEQVGALQELSRLSYLDFTSHLRRAVLNFDTSMKLQGPRRLHPSQYGYFCPSETPSGGHIGVAKNLSIMTAISTGSYSETFRTWLYARGRVVPCEYITPELAAVMVPVYLNSGSIGYVSNQTAPVLARVLRLLKRSGCLPPLSSSGFNIPERRVFIYLDDGRPLRPLILCEPRGHLPNPARFKGRRTWRDLVVGTLLEKVQISSREFIDPLNDVAVASLTDYITFFERNADKLSLIEYVDPYEQNETLIANFPEHVLKETTHMEVHPSTILGLLGNCIPYPNHNQSPRNQLSASQSKQGLSMYATNWNNRFDNTANVLCYGQAPLGRTMYQDYFGEGQMAYGQNIILAMGMYGGYNQEDGIIMNADALARGQFRSINYRSYSAFEEDDRMTQTQIRIGNPKMIPAWLELNTRLDYTKLDEHGIVKVGEYVDQNTVLVGRYQIIDRTRLKDASVTPQVWTNGRVEKVVVMVNNMGLRLVKIKIVQDRVPQLGDKFSNRHGQKGTMNVMYRSTDMPRTAEGITPDMIMNPTAIPSRMTIGQIFEMMFGVVSAELGAIGNVTAFMNDGSPHELLGNLLEKMGLNRMCNQVLYNGMTGEQMTADIYMGVVYGMRLKHMTEDKWNARGVGRKEARTHQPTGGRGNEGGMKLGEMERDAILGHGISAFQNEAYMAKSDGTSFIVCNGCGTIPFYNEKQQFYICAQCDGPIAYSGDTANTLEPIPPPVRSAVTFSKIQMPYSTKLFFQELTTFLNMGLRILTTRDTTRLTGLDTVEELAEVDMEGAPQVLKPLVYQTMKVPERVNQPTRTTAAELQRNIMLLQEDARSAYQSETAAVAASAPAGNAPTAAQVMAAPLNRVQMSVANAGASNTNAAGGGFVAAELAPGSMAPAPLGVAGNVGNVVATTAEGQPVVDLRAETTAEALTNAGLRMPNDATRPIQAQPQPSAGFGMGQPNTGRRSRNRSQSPNNYQNNQGNQGNQGNQNQLNQGAPEFAPVGFEGNQGNGGNGGGGEEDENNASSMKPINPIKVIKEG